MPRSLRADEHVRHRLERRLVDRVTHTAHGSCPRSVRSRSDRALPAAHRVVCVGGERGVRARPRTLEQLREGSLGLGDAPVGRVRVGAEATRLPLGDVRGAPERPRLVAGSSQRLARLLHPGAVRTGPLFRLTAGGAERRGAAPAIASKPVASKGSVRRPPSSSSGSAAAAARSVVATSRTTASVAGRPAAASSSRPARTRSSAAARKRSSAPGFPARIAAAASTSALMSVRCSRASWLTTHAASTGFRSSATVAASSRRLSARRRRASASRSFVNSASGSPYSRSISVSIVRSPTRGP